MYNLLMHKKNNWYFKYFKYYLLMHKKYNLYFKYYLLMHKKYNLYYYNNFKINNYEIYKNII